MRWWATACLLGLSLPVAAAPAAPGPSANDPSGGKTAPAAAATAASPDPMTEARALVKGLYDTAAFIERVQERSGVAGNHGLRGSCVAEKLAEAKISIRLGGEEMERLEQSLARKDQGERDYALRRLRLLSQRTRGLEHDARVCAEDDTSSVDVTEVKVEIAPQIPSGDPSNLPAGRTAPQTETTPAR
jgi:hypothetical protein